MRVALICPSPPRSRLGNRITALRWRRMLRALGHDAFLAQPGPAPRCDVLVALHARRSAESVRSARAERKAAHVVVALTGTDLYRDIHTDGQAQESLELADLLVVLHRGAAAELPRRLRAKVRVVPQSAPAPRRKLAPQRARFEVAVVGHLRAEKDPLRTALAARLLGDDSCIAVVHVGKALDEAQRRAAEREARENPRYRWLGELPSWKARALIARARVLVVSSEMEGGANVVSEAVAAGTPVIATRIPSMRAILGADHPGLFGFGDTRALARLLVRAEREPRFLGELRRRSVLLQRELSPAREQAALRAILHELRLR
jgi:putative glycosyltransferase (TIGR04348 family)